MIIIGPPGHQVDQIAVGEAQLGDVRRIHEDHSTATFDTAIAVAQTVDGRVELIMTTERLQHEMPRRQLEGLDG